MWCLGTKRYPARAYVTAAYPEGVHLNCASYFVKWKFSGLGEFLPMKTDNQKTILTLSKIVGSTPQPGVSREAVISIYGFRFL